MWSLFCSSLGRCWCGGKSRRMTKTQVKRWDLISCFKPSLLLLRPRNESWFLFPPSTPHKLTGSVPLTLPIGHAIPSPAMSTCSSSWKDVDPVRTLAVGSACHCAHCFISTPQLHRKAPGIANAAYVSQHRVGRGNVAQPPQQSLGGRGQGGAARGTARGGSRGRGGRGRGGFRGEHDKGNGDATAAEDNLYLAPVAHNPLYGGLTITAGSTMPDDEQQYLTPVNLNPEYDSASARGTNEDNYLVPVKQNPEYRSGGANGKRAGKKSRGPKVVMNAYAEPTVTPGGYSTPTIPPLEYATPESSNQPQNSHYAEAPPTGFGFRGDDATYSTPVDYASVETAGQSAATGGRQAYSEIDGPSEGFC